LQATLGPVRLARDVHEELEAGLARIQQEFGVPSGFPPDVDTTAAASAARPAGDRVDRTARPFVTLDPASANDLDQAFVIERDGDELILHYAIADVDAFVDAGDLVDQEAWRRGVTIYLPGSKAPLYPAVLSAGAASLLPDGDRPAVVFTVRIDGAGATRLDGVERAVVRSRAKLAYEDVSDGDLPADFGELARRIEAAEERRDAPRVEFPEQELARVDGGWELRISPRLPSEDRNAGMSLATNLAVADALMAAGTGLFRTMAPPDDGAVARLRHTATAFGLTWPDEQSLAQFQRALPDGDMRTAAFLLAVRRAGGRAGYERFSPEARPWHAAIAAPYVHVTAPLRRLADRYVIAAALAVAAGRPVPDDVDASFDSLPGVMARGEGLANRVDRAVLDMAEAVALNGRQGEVFDAVVVDEDRRGPVIQLIQPAAVLANVTAHRVDPGDRIRVRLTGADVEDRRVTFERVG
jgi:exoribonuclease R